MIEWGRRKDNKQSYPKIGPKGVKGAGQITNPTGDVHLKENPENKKEMEKKAFNDTGFGEADVRLIPKKVRQGFSGKKWMLVGIRRSDNEPMYLEQGSWDCGWYYGFGYMEVPNYNFSDIVEHTHFDSILNESKKDWHGAMTEYFSALTIPNSEVWKLVDLMKSFYTLKDTSQVYHSGSSHLTSDTGLKLTDKELEERLLKDQRKVILQVQKLLGMKEEDNNVLSDCRM